MSVSYKVPHRNTQSNEFVIGDRRLSISSNANFDVTNQRMFISSKETGAANDFSFTSGGTALDKLGLSAAAGATKIDGDDAILELNGATFKSSTNTFTINGSTFTANAVSDETITLKTSTDTSGIYDTIKGFFKDYP